MATSEAAAAVVAERTHKNNNREQGKKIVVITTAINKVNLFQGYQKQIQARVQLYKSRKNKDYIVHTANNNKHTHTNTHTHTYLCRMLFIMCYILIHI